MKIATVHMDIKEKFDGTCVFEMFVESCDVHFELWVDSMLWKIGDALDGVAVKAEAPRPGLTGFRYRDRDGEQRQLPCEDPLCVHCHRDEHGGRRDA